MRSLLKESKIILSCSFSLQVEMYLGPFPAGGDGSEMGQAVWQSHLGLMYWAILPVFYCCYSGSLAPVRSTRHTGPPVNRPVCIPAQPRSCPAILPAHWDTAGDTTTDDDYILVSGNYLPRKLRLPGHQWGPHRSEFSSVKSTTSEVKWVWVWFFFLFLGWVTLVSDWISVILHFLKCKIDIHSFNRSFTKHELDIVLDAGNTVVNE